MTHSVTCKLQRDARQFQNAAGMTFFVDLGEKNFNHKTKQSEFTNYSAALFAKDGQIQFYTDVLVEGSVIEVSGTGIIIEMPDDPQYKPRLQIQESKLGFVHSVQAPQQQQQNYQQPQQQQGGQQQGHHHARQQQQNGGQRQQQQSQNNQQNQNQYQNDGQQQPQHDQNDPSIPF